MVDWHSFLTQWSQHLMASDLAERVDPPPEKPSWLGYPPATPNDISDLEKRLGVLLPPSYKSFLLATNGYRRTTFAIGRLRPASEVNWFRIENEDWVDLYAEDGSSLPDNEYFDYSTDHGSAPDHRAQHMKSLIQISDVEDGVYLLNPEAVTPDGEWEAWFFANWNPGAERYPSFAHMMVCQYQSFANIAKIPIPANTLPDLPIPSSRIPRISAERIKTSIPQSDSLESLIEAMCSIDKKSRAKAVRTFHGKLKGRPRSERRPDLTQSLTDLFYAASDPEVRGACVAALTAFAEDDQHPAPLLDALSDGDVGVALQGMFALHYFPDPRCLEPLCNFIESRADRLANETAMSLLRDLGDERAISTLQGVLFESTNKFDQSFGTAACALAACGEKGFHILVKALDHSDPRIRRAAVVGLEPVMNFQPSCVRLWQA